RHHRRRQDGADEGLRARARARGAPLRRRPRRRRGGQRVRPRALLRLQVPVHLRVPPAVRLRPRRGRGRAEEEKGGACEGLTHAVTPKASRPAVVEGRGAANVPQSEDVRTMLSPLKTERRDRRTRARTDEPARCWRVFYTRSRAEKRCAERLEDDGVEVPLPLRRVTRRWSDREKVVEEPLFRGYVFARVDEAERLRALQTDGVVRCLHVGGRPAEMRPEEVERLR